MKRLLLIPLLLSGLALGGCLQSVSDGIKAATTTIANPVRPVNLYQTNLVYRATLKVANEWRDYCWARSYKSLMADVFAKPVCQARRRTLRTILAAEVEAYAAIERAKKFINENPTLDARKVLTAAWDAVNYYKTVAAGTGSATR